MVNKAESNYIPTIKTAPEWAKHIRTASPFGSVSVGSAESRSVFGTGVGIHKLVGNYHAITGLSFQVRQFSGSGLDTIGTASLMNAYFEFYRASSDSECSVDNLIAITNMDEYGYGGFSHEKEFSKRSNKNLWLRVHRLPSGVSGANRLDFKPTVTYLTDRER